MSKKNKLVIPVRFAFLQCWEAVETASGKKYSLTGLIRKDDTETLQKITDAVEYVKEHSIEKWGGRIPNNLKLPLHDGDLEKEDSPIFRNHYFFNAKCKNAPQIVDQDVKPLTDRSKLYSGCYGNVSIILYAYNFNGNRGIAAWLGNIQKVRDGISLSGSSPLDEFQPITESDRNKWEEMAG